MRLINIPKDYIKRKTSTIDFGYELSEIKGYLNPIENHLKCLYVAEEMYKLGYSYAKIKDYIKKYTNKKISEPALYQKFKKSNAFTGNVYNINIEKLKKTCKICNEIFFISPVGSKIKGGSNPTKKYCSESCKKNFTRKQARIKYLLKNINIKSRGYVYCITNKAWEGWVKVGKAVNLENRLCSFNTSTPFRDYKIIFSRPFSHTSRAEYFLLHKLSKQSKTTSGEWFEIDINKAINIVKNHADINITEKNINKFITPKTNFISNINTMKYKN